jgi:serine phosphatase RsbU (regulator of sigma subunit)
VLCVPLSDGDRGYGTLTLARVAGQGPFGLADAGLVEELGEVHPDGRTQVLQGGGLPLGVFADAEPTTQELDLSPGDLLFLFTDGLMSAYGADVVHFEDRITDELAAMGSAPAARVVAGVQEAVLRFCRGQLRDDVSMLALRAGEPPDG